MRSIFSDSLSTSCMALSASAFAASAVALAWSAFCEAWAAVALAWSAFCEAWAAAALAVLALVLACSAFSIAWFAVVWALCNASVVAHPPSKAAQTRDVPTRENILYECAWFIFYSRVKVLESAAQSGTRRSHQPVNRRSDAADALIPV